jgi:ATP/ADP translocase/HEAT repeat protein
VKKLISIFYDIRKNEWQSVLLMFGLHFILMVILYFLKPARDSLFLTENGPGELPYVYMLLALVSMPVTLLITTVMKRYPVRTVLMWTLGLLAANILFIRWLFQYQMEWIFMGFYIWVGIFGILVISLFWLLANVIFKPSQSKRIFSFLTLGAILGSITGSEASSLIVSLLNISTENLLYICVFLLAGGMIILFFIPGQEIETGTSAPECKQTTDTSTVKVARKIFSSPYQLTLTAIIGLAMIATTFTDYQFKTLAFDAYPATSGLTAFMGTFYAGISFVSLGIQVLLSSQIIKKMGLSGAILFRPVGMMIGAILMAIEPVLASVVILNGFDGATRYSIDKTGRELLFLPLSQHTKEQTKVFIDIFVDRFSRGLGGLLLLGFVVVLNWSVYLLTFVVTALLIMWILLGLRAQRGYVDKFRNSVQKQLIGTDNIALNINEPTISSIIRESLHSSSDSQVLHTLFLLEDTEIETLADDIRQLLYHPNKEIKLKALKLLQDVESLNLTEEITELLEDEDPEIRLETIYYLCRHSSEDPTSVIKSYLAHNDYKIKSAALGCASKHGGAATDLVDPDFFKDLLNKKGKDAIVIKAQIADALGYIEDDQISRKYLFQLLDDDHPSVVRKAIASMGRQQNDRFIPLLLRKLEDFEYKIEIRKTLASYGTDYLILYKDRFFNDTLSKDVRKSIPAIFSHLPNQTTADHLFEMIEVEDPDLRYHVIKSLNKLVREQPSLSMNTGKIQTILKNEANNFFELLAMKLLQPSNRPNNILLKALDEKMGQATERIFRLLGLIYDPKDMYGTYLALQSISADKQSAAVEFLDNVLTEEDRRYLFPIIDNRGEQEKVKAGRELFDIPNLRYDEGLLQLMNGKDQWLKTCAIYSVSPQCPSGLQSKVRKLAKSSNKLIKETAELVIRRNSKTSN